MSIKDGTTQYILKRPIKISAQGREQECTFIELYEPTTGQSAKHYFQLKQFMTQAVGDFQKDYPKEMEEAMESVTPKQVPKSIDPKKHEKDSKELESYVAAIIPLSTTVDLSKFMEVFTSMITAGKTQILATCNGEDTLRLNSVRWLKIHPDDQFKIAMRWCSFFVMPSREGENSDSEKLPE